MNRHIASLTLLLALAACQSRQPVVFPDPEPAPTPEPAAEAATPSQNLQQTIAAEGFSSKGTIEAITEVPVYSRISEQIVQFDIELGQRIRRYHSVQVVDIYDQHRKYRSEAENRYAMQKQLNPSKDYKCEGIHTSQKIFLPFKTVFLFSGPQKCFDRSRNKKDKRNDHDCQIKEPMMKDSLFVDPVSISQEKTENHRQTRKYSNDLKNKAAVFLGF